MEVFAKKIIIAANTLKKMGLLPGTSGNISIRYEDKIFITPTGISKDSLKAKDISIIDINNRFINNIKPSSEYRLHTQIYKTRPDINAIIHTHPPYTIAYSFFKQKINYNLTAEFNIIIKKISFCPYVKPQTIELAKLAAKCSLKSDVIVLKNHGLLCLSKDIDMAMILSEEVEHFFKINYIYHTLKYK